jgi:hypothetical protein
MRRQTNCTHCPVGYFCPSTTESIIFACPAGTYSWAVSILALYALLDFIVLMLTLQWSSFAQMAPSPLAVLTTALTALEVSNATLPGAQFLNVPLATTRSKETWTAILVPLATPVHSKISL